MIRKRADRNTRFWRYVQTSNECWLWSGALSAAGYGVLNTKGKVELAHRISFEIHNSDPGSMHVRHKCDNPKCVNPDHLELGNHTDNMIDMGKRFRAASCKLTEEQRAEVLMRFQAGEADTSIARDMNVTTQAIYYWRRKQNRETFRPYKNKPTEQY